MAKVKQKELDLSSLSPEMLYLLNLLENRMDGFDRKISLFGGRLDKTVDHTDELRTLTSFIKNVLPDDVDISRFSGRRIYIDEISKELGVAPNKARLAIHEGKLLAFKEGGWYTYMPNIIRYRMQHLSNIKFKEKDLPEVIAA